MSFLFSAPRTAAARAVPPAGGAGASGRRGVGLIIALGLLSLLMITGVSFAILMRIERAGSANLRHATAARQMAKGGLNYAIASILQDQSEALALGREAVWTNRRFSVVTGSGTFNEPRTAQEDKDDVLWIDDNIFISQDQTKSKTQYKDVSLARVLSAELAQHLPAADRDRIAWSRIGGKDYASPEWIPVMVGGSPIGRYAFIALETTGRLDANRVQAADRWTGASAKEIRLDKDVVLDVSDAQKFANARNTYGRYETIPELARNPGIDGNDLANFDVFSYGLPDRIPDKPAIDTAEAKAAHDDLKGRTKGRRIDLGDLHNYASFDASKQKRIKDQSDLAFKASGLNAEQAKWAFLGLLDYVDDDNVPAGAPDEQFNRPATEAMPLFSQVMLQVWYKTDDLEEVDADGDKQRLHQMVFQVIAVYAYPFQTPTGPFNLEANVFLGMQTFGKWSELGNTADLTPAGTYSKISLTKNNVACSVDNNTVTIVKEEKFKQIKKKQSEGYCDTAFLVVEANAQTKNGNNVILRKSPHSLINELGNSPVQIAVEFTPQDIDAAKKNEAFFWCEVIDSRYNHHESRVSWRANRADMGLWQGEPEMAPLNKLPDILPAGFVCPPFRNPDLYGALAEHVLATPKALKDYLMIYTDGVRIGDDGPAHCDPVNRQVRAHVADRPLQSVGELGYLPIGLWLTINLIDHGHNPNNMGNLNYPNNTLPAIGYHPVLDYFTIGDPDKPRWGQVNLNAASEEVLGAVFNQLPLRTESAANTPASPGPVIPAKASKSLDDALELGEWLYDRGPFTRLSDLGRLFRGTPQIGISSTTQTYNNKDPLQALQESMLKIQNVPGKGGPGFGEFEREALIRNACELVTMRGRTFTIVLRADAFAPSFGMSGVKQGNVLSTAMAVAQVWCDTVKDDTVMAGSIQYPCFVQFFKILNE